MEAWMLKMEPWGFAEQWSQIPITLMRSSVMKSRIRIRIKSEKSDSFPHQSEKPDPDPHQVMRIRNLVGRGSFWWFPWIRTGIKQFKAHGQILRAKIG
jgi:hypothetical protein